MKKIITIVLSVIVISNPLSGVVYSYNNDINISKDITESKKSNQVVNIPDINLRRALNRELHNFNDLEAEEHMHCFVLYYLNNKVYQIEHPNWMRIGIYEFASEETAIKEINDYYIEMAEGMPRPLTEYYEVTPNISFKEFNNYINSLDTKSKTPTIK